MNANIAEKSLIIDWVQWWSIEVAEEVDKNAAKYLWAHGKSDKWHRKVKKQGTGLDQVG